MPPVTSRSGGRLRQILIPLTVVVAAATAYAFDRLGPFLALEHQLQKADAIVVMAGTPMTRPLEAADLYLAGYAPTIVMTRPTPEGGERALAARGIPFDEDVQRARSVFLKLGIPEAAILIPPKIHDSTAAEAITIRELAGRHRWRRVIVVSSHYHLRRTAFAFGRELGESNVEVMMRGSRYDGLQPERWWRTRSDIRTIIPEVPKLIAYLLGLGA